MSAVSELYGPGRANRASPPAAATDERVVEILRILRDHGIEVTPVAVIDNDGNEVEEDDKPSS